MTTMGRQITDGTHRAGAVGMAFPRSARVSIITTLRCPGASEFRMAAILKCAVVTVITGCPGQVLLHTCSNALNSHADMLRAGGAVVPITYQLLKRTIAIGAREGRTRVSIIRTLRITAARQGPTVPLEADRVGGALGCKVRTECVLAAITSVYSARVIVITDRLRGITVTSID